MKYRFFTLLLIAFVLTGCARSSSGSGQPISDPLEGFNRAMFDFNYQVLDPYILRPLAVTWKNVLPVPLRAGLSRFLSNLEEPAAMANALVRVKPREGMIHFTRFFLNTLFGLGGFVDVAGRVHPVLAQSDIQRFGSTLGYYNVIYGPYLVLPGYGSATLRDEGGDYVDTLYPALSWLNIWAYLGKGLLQGIETRAQLLDSDSLLQNSTDPYTFVKSAYYQRHNFLVNGGEINVDNPANPGVAEEFIDEIDGE